MKLSPAPQTASEPETMANDLSLDQSQFEAQRRAEHMRLKRVLFVLRLDPAGKFGSMEEQVLTLARSFRDRGSLFLPVFLKPLDFESASQYRQEALTAEALDLTHFRPGTLGRLLGLVRRHQIQVVHWNFYHPLLNGYLWALTMLRPGIEHYFTDHISRPGMGSGPNNQRRLKGELKRLLLSRYHKSLCISDFVLAQARQSNWPESGRVHYFINTDRFKPDPSVRRHVRRALGMEEMFVAVTVAYLIKAKGIDVAINAFAQLPDGAVLWVVGGGPEQSNLEALATERGVGHRVQFLGPKRNVEPLMQAADCALCPSLWGEAVGLVNLEAMACGLPVIASRVGGIPEFVEDGRNGFLFDAGDPQALAQRIQSLMVDESLRTRMGREARSSAVARFSAQSRVQEQLNLYAL